MTDPPPPRPLPAPGPPPHPTGRQKPAQARWDAALELIRAGDTLREIAVFGRDMPFERIRYTEAEKAWARVNGRRWPS